MEFSTKATWLLAGFSSFTLAAAGNYCLTSAMEVLQILLLPQKVHYWNTFKISVVFGLQSMAGLNVRGVIQKLLCDGHWNILQTTTDLFLRPLGVHEGIDRTALLLRFFGREVLNKLHSSRRKNTKQGSHLWWRCAPVGGVWRLVREESNNQLFFLTREMVYRFGEAALQGLNWLNSS